LTRPASRGAAAALALLLGAAGAGGADAPPPDIQSLARRCEVKIVQLKSGHPPESLRVSEAEVNAYIDVFRDELFYSAARKIRVRLEKDRVNVLAVADLGRARIRLESPLHKAFVWILSGEHRYEARVHFRSGKGVGRYRVERLKVDGITVPDSLAAFLAAQAGRLNRPPMPPGQDFPLPYNLERCEVLPQAFACYPRPR
jgi:hypothetical protein